MGCTRSPQAKQCPTEGKPVNPILGIKILTETPDLHIDAPLPLIWRRTYASDVAQESLLGQGWRIDLGYTLERASDRFIAYDGYGKPSYFPLMETEASHLLPKEQLELSCIETGRYLLHSFSRNRFYSFESNPEIPEQYRLTHIEDNNHNRIQYHYTAEEALTPGYLSLDNGRLFLLDYQASRLKGITELILEAPSPGTHVVATAEALFVLRFYREEQRLRVSTVERFSPDSKEMLMERHSLQEIPKATQEPLVRYGYSAENDLSTVYHKERLIRSFGYSNHLLTYHGVPGGLESYYEYDQYSPEGKVIKNHTNTGQVWYFAYQENQTTVTDALGRETVYEYTDDHYFTAKTDALHQTSRMSYDKQHGFLTAITDVTGERQEFGYDDKGEMTANREGGGITTLAYHLKHHKPILIEDSSGTTHYQYDSRGNLIQERLPNKSTIEYTRDTYGNAIEIKDPLGGISHLAYNSSGNLTRHTNPRGETTELRYDRDQHLIELIDIYGHHTYYGYDSRGQLTQISHPDGAEESFGYDERGRLHTHTDSFGITTSYTTDKADNLVALSRGDKQSIYEYDLADRLHTQTEPNGTQTSYRYDPLDRLIAITNEAKETTDISYTPHDTIESITDPTGATSTYRYDTKGNMTQEQYLANTSREILYDMGSMLPMSMTKADKEILFYGFTPTKQLESIGGEDGMIRFAYDEHDRVVDASSEAHTIEYEYDITSTPSQETQDGVALATTHTPSAPISTLRFLEHTETITNDIPNHTATIETQAQRIELRFDPKARIQTIKYPNGTQEVYTFSQTQELESLQTADILFGYARDSIGKITSIALTGDDEKLSITTYNYDIQGRLTHIKSDTKSTAFKYDKAGNNLLQERIYDAKTNQLLEDSNHTYAYDLNGNLTSKTHKHTEEETRYRYNSFDQLIKVITPTTTLKYSYDALGRRVSKQTESVSEPGRSTQHYLYNNQNIVAILDEHKNALATIVHHPTQIDTPLSITNHQTNETYYYHRDHQGSIIALSNEAGKIAERIEYDGSYGKITSHDIQEETFNPYGYTGRETDMQDLYYYRARYYDPTTQRFLTLDPIGYRAGDFNWYRYVGNDPVNFVDPSGLDMNTTQFVRDTYVNIATAGGGVASNVLGPVTTILQDPQTTISFQNGVRHMISVSNDTDPQSLARKRILGKDKSNISQNTKIQKTSPKDMKQQKEKTKKEKYCECMMPVINHYYSGDPEYIRRGSIVCERKATLGLSKLKNKICN